MGPSPPERTNTVLMRVLHITESHAKKDGGVTTVVNDLTQHLYDEGVASCVMAATDIQEPVPDGVDFIAMGFACNSLKALFSSKFKENIRRVIREKHIDVIHIHGIWMPLQIVTARLAKELGIPFIVTSHGMLEPWLWKGKGFANYVKKKLYFHLLVKPTYQHAKAIHAITPNEARSLQTFFPTSEVKTIPNAIDTSNSMEVTEGKPSKYIFFIGRITPVKGVKLLLQAFHQSNLAQNGWKLVIAGPEEVPEYAQELKDFVANHDLSESIAFVGSVFGLEKERLYKNAWVTVVPSFSEVIGMVNLEASLYQCPTITTHQGGLNDWEEGGGLLIDPEVAQLTEALLSCTQWTEDERRQRGDSSLKLVEEKYSWHHVVKLWLELYMAQIQMGNK